MVTGVEVIIAALVAGAAAGSTDVAKTVITDVGEQSSQLLDEVQRRWHVQRREVGESAYRVEQRIVDDHRLAYHVTTCTSRCPTASGAECSLTEVVTAESVEGASG